jgi:DNA-binding response OmpR family regulator
VNDVPRIALIESDDLIRLLAVRWLQATGYPVLCTSVQQLRAQQAPLLIIADIPHPRSAAAMIRSLRTTHDAPILLVSGRFHRMQGSSKDLAGQLGVAAVLAKPYTADELLRAVAAALGQAGS